MNNQLFISRPIDSTQYAWPRILQRGWNIQGESLIKFSPRSFVLPHHYDWIYFSSKKGVEYFFCQLSEYDHQLVKKIKLAAIGKSTSEVLDHYVDKIDVIFDGNPRSAAAYFDRLDIGTKILFPHAMISNRTTQRQLSADIECIDLIVYDNCINPTSDIQKANIVILTSSLSAEGFFSHYTFNKPEIIFVAGESTLNKVHELTDTKPIILSSFDEERWSEEVLQHIATGYKQ